MWRAHVIFLFYIFILSNCRQKTIDLRLALEWNDQAKWQLSKEILIEHMASINPTKISRVWDVHGQTRVLTNRFRSQMKGRNTSIAPCEIWTFDVFPLAHLPPPGMIWLRRPNLALKSFARKFFARRRRLIIAIVCVASQRFASRRIARHFSRCGDGTDPRQKIANLIGRFN